MSTNFTDGVSSYGMPVNGARFSSPWATNYFVDYDNGLDAHDGKTPDNAKKTIQAAVTAASAQDVIYIRPRAWQNGQGFRRYGEDVTVTIGGVGGSGVVASNAGMSLIGITPRGFPNDHLGVRWKYATATNLTVHAPALHVENIGFFSEDATYAINLLDSGVSRTQQGSNGFSIYNCSIKGAYLYANGIDGVNIVNCQFQAKYDGSVAAIHLVGSTNQVKRPIIDGCHFIGGNANNMSGPCIIGAAPWLDAIIRNCWFHANPDNNIVINIAGSSSTGSIANCHFAIADISTTRIVEGGLIATGMYDGGGLATAT